MSARALGVQTFADLYDCDPSALDDANAVRAGMLEAARRCGATVIGHCFHRYSPHGVSGVVIIAESHLAIHTWPEHGYAALDLFTCGESLDPEACFSHLREVFGARRHSTTTVHRGDGAPRLRPAPGAEAGGSAE